MITLGLEGVVLLPLTERLHFPEHDAERPHVPFEAVVVVLEVFRGIPAKGHSMLQE